MALTSVERRGGKRDWAEGEVGLQHRLNNSCSLLPGEALELEWPFSIVLTWDIVLRWPAFILLHGSGAARWGSHRKGPDLGRGVFTAEANPMVGR